MCFLFILLMNGLFIAVFWGKAGVGVGDTLSYHQDLLPALIAYHSGIRAESTHLGLISLGKGVRVPVCKECPQKVGGQKHGQ